MNFDGKVLDSFTFLIKYTLILGVFYYHLRNKNRIKLRNPYFRSIDKILSKYYSSYFFKFHDLQFYPKLKFIYRNMLFEFLGEGIYPEILESYIKIEAKKVAKFKPGAELADAVTGVEKK